MAVGSKLGCPLFSLRPDLFPEGRLTVVEIGLWARYFEQQNELKNQLRQQAQAR